MNAAGALADSGPNDNFNGPDRGARTIPYFSSSFTYNGQTYKYRMVGTDPTKGPGTTHVRTEIIPLRVVLSTGQVFDATPDAQITAQSPIFQPAQFDSGNTQYGDAVMRGEFWTTGGSGDYHVLLDRPQILPTVEIHVPADKATIVHCPCGDPTHDTAHIDDQWLTRHYIRAIKSSDVSPDSLPIVLGHRVEGNTFSGDHAVILNPEHGDRRDQIQTYIYARTREDIPSPPAPPGGLHNTSLVSHEVAEWLNDPFADNIVPNWISPIPFAAQSYGCMNLLEVGDPLLSKSLIVNSYLLQDEAFYSWFTRQNPSIGINGRYSLFGGLTSPAPSC